LDKLPIREFYHTFRNRRWKICITDRLPDNANGDCDNPSVSGKKIRLRRSAAEKDFLQAAIDEGIHACNWDIDNEMVDEWSTCIASYLWKLGFRLHRNNAEEKQEKSGN